MAFLQEAASARCRVNLCSRPSTVPVLCFQFVKEALTHKSHIVTEARRNTAATMSLAAGEACPTAVSRRRMSVASTSCAPSRHSALSASRSGAVRHISCAMCPSASSKSRHVSPRISLRTRSHSLTACNGPDPSARHSDRSVRVHGFRDKVTKAGGVLLDWLEDTLEKMEADKKVWPLASTFLCWSRTNMPAARVSSVTVSFSTALSLLPRSSTPGKGPSLFAAMTTEAALSRLSKRCISEPNTCGGGSSGTLPAVSPAGGAAKTYDRIIQRCLMDCCFAGNICCRLLLGRRGRVGSSPGRRVDRGRLHAGNLV